MIEMFSKRPKIGYNIDLHTINSVIMCLYTICCLMFLLNYIYEQS